MHSAFSGLPQQLPRRKQCLHNAVVCRYSSFRLGQRATSVKREQAHCRATLTKPSRQTAQHAPAHVSQRSSSQPASTSSHHPATFESLRLHTHNPASNDKLDLIVAGAGPSGIAVAERVSAAGYKVCVVDPAPLAHWPNNYGVWVDEFAAMGLDDCLEITWPQAKVHLDSGKDDERCTTLLLLANPGTTDVLSLRTWLFADTYTDHMAVLTGPS